MEETLPNITGIIFNPVNTSGAFKTTTTLMEGGYYNNEGNIGPKVFQYQVDFSASESNSTYQDKAHVRPLSINTTFLMKY